MENLSELKGRTTFSVNMHECIDNCLEASKVCQSCLQHCLSLGGKHAQPEHISLLLETAEICHVTATFMLATSKFTHELAGVCSRVCDAAAQSLNEMDPEDPHMVKCMTICKKTADACRNLEH
jgi:hypothetical protein